MPVTSAPTSYITVVPAFLNHWEDAEALEGPIELDGAGCGQPADVSRAGFQAMYDELLAARGVLEGTLLEAALQAGQVVGDRTWLQAQIVAFNKTVRALHGSTVFAKVLPEAPQLGSARENFNRPLRTLKNLWPKLDAYRAGRTPPLPPLELPSTGATAVAYVARLAALVEHQDTQQEREEQADLEREVREAVQRQIYPVLKIYRLKIEALFPANAAIIQALPALTDDGTGTPEAGGLTGSLNGAGTAVTLKGKASPSGTVSGHQLRASVGPEASAADESVQAKFAPGEALALTSAYGLGVPGAKVHWRLVAVTEDGHEKGSPWLTFQRPL